MSSVTELRLKPPGPVVGSGSTCLQRESLEGWGGVGDLEHTDFLSADFIVC